MGDGVKIACKSVANCFFCRHTWPGFASGHPALLCEIIMTQVIYLFKVNIVSTSLSVQNILTACLIDWMNELHSNLRPFFSSSLLILTLRNCERAVFGWEASGGCHPARTGSLSSSLSPPLQGCLTLAPPGGSPASFSPPFLPSSRGSRLKLLGSLFKQDWNCFKY